MDTPALTGAGAELAAMSADAAGASGISAWGAAAVGPALGLVGGDYAAALLGAFASTEVEVGRLAAFYASAAGAAVQTVAAVAAQEADGAAAVTGTLAGTVAP